MIFPRALRLAGLLCTLGACGERTMDDAASDPPRDATSVSDTAAAASSTGRAEPGVPAFVADSMTAGDSTAASDSTAGIHSVYTSLAEADCRLVERDEETGATSSRCPGAAGYTLLVHDWDARMTVDVVAPGGRAHRLRYSGVITSNFSSLGPRAEWRMRNGAPTALIIRVNAFEDPEAPNRATSYLAVARITPRGACVTGRIPPGANANEAARQAADQSPLRPCMADLGSQ